MSDNSAPSQVDPGLPPSESQTEKAKPIDPNQHRGLARLPNDAKSTLSRADQFILHLSRYVLVL
jgi:hypothetical protein